MTHSPVDLSLLYKLAAAAVDDVDARQVLGDYVLETEWFDPRVMQLLWPITKSPRHGWSTRKKRDRAKIDREAYKAGFPDMFEGCAMRPTTSAWPRAIVAVCIFRGWRIRRWPLVDANHRAELERWKNTPLRTFRQVREDARNTMALIDRAAART